MGLPPSYIAPAETDDAITEIIPFLEFDALRELGVRHGSAFDSDMRVLAADELDDLSDADDLVPLDLLLTPPEPVDTSTAGRHRRSSPTRTWRREAMLAGVGGGALMAAAFASAIPHGTSFTAAAASVANAPAASSRDGLQVVAVQPAAATGQHQQELAVATAFATERATREARMNRPLAVAPTRGIATSAFGMRWGALHGGIDVANAVGTPIVAAADGVVIASGPTPGFGLWVKIEHADGTVTLYGHIDTTTVSVGDRVMAGDQIATMGNRGNSTGPHLHMEVHRGGSEKIDPLAWLQNAGADVAPLGF